MNKSSSKLLIIGILVAALILVLILFRNGTIPGWSTDEEQEQIPENSVFAQLTLNIDMPTEDELQTFNENFKNDIVSLFNGVTAEKVLIINIVEGSVVVDFYIAPAEDGTSLVTTEEFSDALSPGVSLPSVGATLTSESITSGPYIVSEDGNAIVPDTEPDQDAVVSDPCVGVVCAASGPCKVAGTCSNGVCSAETNAVDNTPCDDGDPVTTNDICTSGICSGTDPCAGVVCTSSDPCIRPGTCSNGVCSGGTWANGDPCDDGNPVTINDTCSYGRCEGTSISTGTLTMTVDPFERDPNSITFTDAEPAPVQTRQQCLSGCEADPNYMSRAACFVRCENL